MHAKADTEDTHHIEEVLARQHIAADADKFLLQKLKKNMAGDNIDNVITGGIVFHGSKRGGNKKEDGFHTKAKKKGYVTGSHGSASAKKKADIRKKRAARPSQRRSK